MTFQERKGYLMALQTVGARLDLVRMHAQHACCGLAFNSAVSQARRIVKSMVDGVDRPMPEEEA